MATVKLTKTELRDQQKRLKLFEGYLPTLRNKKALLQKEVYKATAEIGQCRDDLFTSKNKAVEFSPLLLDKSQIDVVQNAEISYVKKHYENMAGVEIPIFDEVVFQPVDYFLFDTPIWADRATELLREFVIAREKMHISEEKKRALEKELHEVSIRVNLFEKILIPRALENIRKIKIFLGDQQLAAVCQAKVAKAKIKKKKEAQL